jgi:DNA-binding response OmpR family regulator
MTEGPILLVEDDPTLAAILAHYLEGRGHPVALATSAEDAQRRLGGGLRPSLVVLDINLPGESGWTLVRGGALAAAGGPPVIVTSATPVSPARLREHAVAGYLPKPFAIEALMDCVDRLTQTQEERMSPREIDT